MAVCSKTAVCICDTCSCFCAMICSFSCLIAKEESNICFAFSCSVLIWDHVRYRCSYVCKISSCSLYSGNRWYSASMDCRYSVPFCIRSSIWFICSCIWDCFASFFSIISCISLCWIFWASIRLIACMLLSKSGRIFSSWTICSFWFKIFSCCSSSCFWYNCACSNTCCAVW